MADEPVIAPGTPASGGLQDAPNNSPDEAAFVLNAMDELSRDDSDEEVAGEPASAEPPPVGASSGVPATSPNQQELPVVTPVAATVPPPGEVVNPAAVQQQVLPNGQTAPVQAPQPTPPGQGGQQVAPPVVPPAGVQPAQDESPEEGFRRLYQQFEANREAIIGTVAEHAYRLSEDELVAVQTEPEKVLPKLMARVHVNAVQGVLQHVAQQIPSVVHGLLQARDRYSELEGKFFEQWPQLDKTKHKADVARLAAAYRQQNPNAAFDEVSKVVGAQAIVMLGLHQATNGVRPTAQPPRQVPFQPAVAGGVQAPVGSTPQNPYQVWDQMIEADDAGAFDDS